MSKSKFRVKVLVVAMAALLPLAALAESDYRSYGGNGDRGREGRGIAQAEVIRSVPQYETVRVEVPREVCSERDVPRRRGEYSATGPVLGAVVGGAIGNAVGHGKTNKRVGAVVGALLGGAVGHDISRRNQERDGGYGYETRRECSVESEYQEEDRLTGYEVTYRYAGETYTTFMDRDPGRRIRVRVAVTPVNDDYNRDWRR